MHPFILRSLGSNKYSTVKHVTDKEHIDKLNLISNAEYLTDDVRDWAFETLGLKAKDFNSRTDAERATVNVICHHASKPLTIREVIARLESLGNLDGPLALTDCCGNFWLAKNVTPIPVPIDNCIFDISGPIIRID